MLIKGGWKLVVEVALLFLFASAVVAVAIGMVAIIISAMIGTVV